VDDRKSASGNENVARGEERPMITWVLVKEPNAAVRAVIEMLEERVGSDAEVMWLCPEAPEPVQD
jgi:hypothetical protein